MPVVLDLGADVECDEPGCKRSVAAEVCLGVGGELLFRPTSPGSMKDWGVRVAGNGGFSTRCPEHVQMVAPATPADDITTKLRKAH